MAINPEIATSKKTATRTGQSQSDPLQFASVGRCAGSNPARARTRNPDTHDAVGPSSLLLSCFTAAENEIFDRALLRSAIRSRFTAPSSADADSASKNSTPSTASDGDIICFGSRNRADSGAFGVHRSGSRPPARPLMTDPAERGVFSFGPARRQAPEPSPPGWTLRFRARDPSDCGHPARLAPPAVDTMLEHMNFRGYEDARGVHFLMRDGQKLVRVFVTRAALEGQRADLAEGGFLPRFEPSAAYTRTSRGQNIRPPPSRRRSGSIWRT
jgi:hypothetical protein